ncbi:type II secretion system F family protein [Bacillus sp. FJAT-27251]|uniref:type II secretion system F family protein n=1 Tax=Bacillus sp. FJAT-27251 TaxID=1684142 RepID=UPI0006A7E69B|nr:type II secretion system F family protein [Bacillus sp. FJAT-27251]
MEEIRLLTAIFIITSLVCFLFLKSASKKRNIAKRVETFLPADHQEESSKPDGQKSNPLKNMVSSFSKVLQNVEFSKKTEKLLLEAGSHLKPEEFFVLKLFTVAALGLFVYVMALPWYMYLAAFLAGFIVPDVYMKRKRTKRLKLISYQLVEILGMMANSMRAGFSFMQAMQLVGKEMPDPLGPEFERVVRQAGLGIPLDEVFQELVERLPNKELEVVVRAILAQRKSGGNLAALMETMEETVRGRIRILEELNTLTAQGRMSSWVITLLPVGLGLYLATANKDYFGPMLDHPLGLVMLSMAGVSIIIGWLFIQKIIKIEV